MEEAWRVIEQRACANKPTMVVTANSEILWHARRHPAYWHVLQRADLRLVDSFGLKLVGLLSGALPVRLTGIEFTQQLLQVALRKRWRVALIGGAPGVAKQAAEWLDTIYPNLILHTEYGGAIQDHGSDDVAGASSRARLKQFAPDVLLVAFGHPKQEAWIAKHLPDFTSVKIAVGIGGAIDYWAAIKTRAPSLLQTLGLEWLWRLGREPKRWRRIIRAVLLFPGAVLIDKLFKYDYQNSRRD